MSKSIRLSSFFRKVKKSSLKSSVLNAKSADKVTLEQIIPLIDSSHSSTTTSVNTGKTSKKLPVVSSKGKSSSKKFAPSVTVREASAVKWPSESQLRTSEDSTKNVMRSITSMLWDNDDTSLESLNLPSSNMANDKNSKEHVLDIPWYPITSLKCVSQHRRKELSRERKQKYIYKNTQSRRFDQLVTLCGDKLGTEATLEIFGKLQRETGLKEYNALIGLCIKNAKNSLDEDESLEHIYKAFQIFRAMREQGFQLKEVTYGPLLTYFVDMEMVEEFQYFSKVITNENPAAVSRLGYYEMLLWIKVDDEDKVQELCNSIGVNNESGVTNDGVGLAENYLLALCESDRKEELVKLLNVIDVTKVSSSDYLSKVFMSLGRRKLEKFAEKFILALKGSEAGEEKLSHFIYSYSTSIPDLVVEDAILEFKNLHEKFNIPPSSLSYEKLVRYCCDLLEVHAAFDIVDQMCQLGFSLSIEIFHPLLDAVEESCELDLVRPIYSLICHHYLKPSSETFRRMIYLFVRMKDFEGAYNMLTDLKEMEIMPTTHMYNSIMAGYFREKNIIGGLKVFNQMKQADVNPDSQTYSWLISNCEREEDIVKYYEELQSSKVQATKQVYMAIINAYVNCGQFQKAKQVVLKETIPVKYINEIKSALVSALASHGQISDAVKIYEEIKQDGSRLEPKAVISLIEYLQSEGELDRLMELLGELTDLDNWLDGCERVIVYCVKYNDLSTAVDLLKQLKGKDELIIYAVIDQVFAKISEAEPSALDIGLEFLKAIKEDLGLHPSRTSLDFLLATCANAKDAPRAWLIWEEYQKAGLVFNVLSFLRMHQVLLASGEHKAANIMLKRIATDDPHVRYIIKESRATFGNSKSKKCSKGKCK